MKITFNHYIENTYDETPVSEFLLECETNNGSLSVKVFAVFCCEKRYEIKDPNILSWIENEVDFNQLANQAYLEYVEGYGDYLYEEAKDKRLGL